MNKAFYWIAVLIVGIIIIIGLSKSRQANNQADDLSAPTKEQADTENSPGSGL